LVSLCYWTSRKWGNVARGWIKFRAPTRLGWFTLRMRMGVLMSMKRGRWPGGLLECDVQQSWGLRQRVGFNALQSPERKQLSPAVKKLSIGISANYCDSIWLGPARRSGWLPRDCGRVHGKKSPWIRFLEALRYYSGYMLFKPCTSSDLSLVGRSYSGEVSEFSGL
jgi:hypothetical protein